MTLLRQDMTKENLLKVNVQFELQVPIKKDSAGRRMSIPDQVSSYISDYFADLQVEMQAVKYKHIQDSKDNYDCQGDFDIFDKVQSVDTSETLAPLHSEELRVRWEQQKDLECWEFFKMNWKEFKTLSWTDQVKLREENGVIWENNTWVRKAE